MFGQRVASLGTNVTICLDNPDVRAIQRKRPRSLGLLKRSTHCLDRRKEYATRPDVPTLLG